jgi:hypothetical protein
MNANYALSHIPTLDERWLEYVARTRPVFDAHPDLVPLRQQIFKSFVERKAQLSSKEQLKHLAKLMLKRQKTDVGAGQVDVVFWLELLREVHTQALLPVLAEVQRLGLRPALIVPSTLSNRLNGISQQIAFQLPYRKQSGSGLQRAWDDLRQALPQDTNTNSFSAFGTLYDTSGSCVEEIKRILVQLRPRVLVLAMDQLLSGSAACEAARQLGIPSLVLMHGAVLPYNAPLTAEHMGVWGSVGQEQLAALGIPSEKLVILGSPRHDKFPQIPADARHRFQQALGLSDRPCLVFFSNGNDALRNSKTALEGCAEWLAAAAQHVREKIEIVVRLHPNEGGSLYTKYSHLRVFKNECDLETTLAGADICAALCSTALLDAMLYHKPVLQFYADGWPDLADNWRRGLSQRIASSQQLIETLTSGLREWEDCVKRQDVHLESVFANRGRATHVVAQYLAEQVQ